MKAPGRQQAISAHLDEIYPGQASSPVVSSASRSFIESAQGLDGGLGSGKHIALAITVAAALNLSMPEAEAAAGCSAGTIIVNNGESLNGCRIGTPGTGSTTVMNVNAGGRTSATTLNSIGQQGVYNGGLSVSTTINNGGGQWVHSGGSANLTTVNSGGRQDIRNGGRATSTTINASGSQSLSSGGSATSVIINSGGEQRISSGGLATSTTVNSSGWQMVSNGGLATSTTVNAGGLQFISSGGTATSTTISANGSQSLWGSAASTTVSSGGMQEVLSGGRSTDTTQQEGGNVNVTVTGGDTATLVSGTNEKGGFSLSSGVASGFVINDGGTQVINSGGTAISTTLNSGGKLTIDSSSLHSGSLTVASGGLIEGILTLTDQSQLSGHIEINNNLTLATQHGTDNVTLAGDSTQLVYNKGTDESLAANLDGAGSLTKTGSGTLTLTGSNSYSGGTTVSGGTLSGNSNSLQGNVHTADATNVTFNQTSNGTFAGVIDGTGSLNKTGTGNLTLTGSNTYTGGTTVSGGTLTGNSNSLQGNVHTADATNVTFDQVSSGSFAGVIDGAGSLNKTGSGTLILTGNNTYGGRTTVSNGTLSGNIASGTDLEIGASGTYQANGSDRTLNALTGSGSLSMGGNTVTVASGTFAGVIGGTGSLTKTGSGTLTLTGSNSYSGGTTVSGGTLTGNSNSLQGNVHTADATNVTFNQTSNGTFAGVIDGRGSLTKTGSGTLILTGTHTYSGGTTVSNGTLSGNSESLQGNIHTANATHITFDQASDGSFAGVIDGSGSLTKTGTGTLTLTGSNSYSGGTTVSNGTLTGNSESLQGNIHTADATHVTFDQTSDGIYHGNMTGTGSLIKTGSGTLILTGTHAYTGGTTVSGGTLSGNIASGTDLEIGASATYQADGSDRTLNALTGSGTLAMGANTVTVASGNFAGVIDGTGSLTKTGSGTLTLTGNNTYSGGTTVSGGTLTGNSNSLQGNIHTADATHVTFDQISNGTFAGVIDGAGSLTKTGSGTLILTGSNTYSGGTTVSNGTLSGNSESLQGNVHTADATNVTFDQASDGSFTGVIDGAGSLTKTGSGTLILTGSNTYSGGTTVSNGTLTGNSDSLQGNVHTADATNVTFDQTSSGSYHGNMTGSGSFTKVGTGTLTLTGSNTYTGGTMLDSGALTGNSESLQGDIHTADATNVTFDQTSNGTFAGVIDGGGSLTKTGSGTLTLTGSNTYSGGTTVSNGTLSGNSDSLQGNVHTADATNVTFEQASNGSFAGVIDGTGSLTKTGSGTLTLTGSHTYTGGTTVSGGTLTGNSDSLQGNVHTADATHVTFDQNSNGTFAGVIGGSGSLTKTGSGTLILTGSNTYTGGTVVSNGTLSGNSESLQGDILTADATNVTFDQNSNGSYHGNMIGTGSLTKTGSGILTLTGNHTYSGGTTLDSGTLTLDGGTLNSTLIGQAGTHFNLINGASFTGIIDPTNLFIDNAQWTNTGNSAVANLTLQNSGQLRFAPSEGFKTLSVSGKLSGNGLITLNTDLGNLQGDRLIFTDTASLSGDYILAILNQGDDPAAPRETLEIIHAQDAASNNARFALQGGYVDAGAYRYTLEQGGITQPEGGILGTAGNWYLYNTGRESQMSAQLRALGTFIDATMIGASSNLENRLGELRLDSRHTGGLWSRTYHKDYHHTLYENVQGNQKVSGIDIGADRLISEANGRLYIGGLASYGQSDFKTVDNAKFDSTHYQLGLYATWLHEGGTYLDLTARYFWFDRDYRFSQGNAAFENASNKSEGMLFSLEAGHRIDLVQDWFIEPQAQLTLMRSKAFEVMTDHGSHLSYETGKGTLLRGGLMIGKTLRDQSHTIQVYARADRLEYLQASYNSSVNGTPLSSKKPDGSWMLTTGAQVQYKNMQFYLEADANIGSSDIKQRWGINAGARWMF